MKKILVSLLMVLLAVPAMAFSIPMEGDEKVSIYGSVRMNLYTDFSGKDVSNKSGGVESTTGSTPFVNNALHYGMQGNSRFGVNFNLGNVFGQVETNFVTDAIASSTTDSRAIGFRQLWAGYKFDNGLTVQVGQQFNIAEAHTQFSDIWDTDNGLANYGVAASFRAPSIRVSMFGATVAIIDDGARIVPAFNNAYGKTAFQVDGDAQFMPRLEAAYVYAFDGGSAKVFGSFSDRVYNNMVVTGQDTDGNDVYGTGTNQYDLVSASAGLYATYTVAGIQIKATGFWGYNASSSSTAGLDSSAIGGLAPVAVYKNNGTVDKINGVTSFGGAIEAGYSINEMFTVIAGVGGSMNSSPSYSSTAAVVSDDAITTTTTKVANTDSAYNTLGVFVVAPITLGKGFSVRPSVGYYTHTTTTGNTTTTTVADSVAKTSTTTDVKTENKVVTDFLLAGAQFRFDF